MEAPGVRGRGVSGSVETPSGKTRHDENFPVGSVLIRRALRPHVHAFYTFARNGDDIADDGVVIVNSSRTPSELGLDELSLRVVTVPATDLARQRLGRPLPNTCLLGALAGLTGVVELSALQVAMLERFEGDSGDRNALLAADGFRMGIESPEGVRRAQAG